MSIKIKLNNKGEPTELTKKRLMSIYLRAGRKNKWEIINRLVVGKLDGEKYPDILVIKSGNCYCKVLEHNLKFCGKYVRIWDDYLQDKLNDSFTYSYEEALADAEFLWHEFDNERKLKAPDIEKMTDDELVEWLHEHEETRFAEDVWEEIKRRGIKTTYAYENMPLPGYLLNEYQKRSNTVVEKTGLQEVLE